LPYSQLLTEIELDALNELINMGVSRAAGALRELVGEQVHLSVPRVSLLTRGQAIDALTALADDGLVSVYENFQGSFSGHALLVFPLSKSLDLVAAVMARESAATAVDVQSWEEEALAETGNIILTSCLSTIANLLQQHVEISPPSIVKGTGETLLEAIAPRQNEVILYQDINFTLKRRDLRGAIVMLMDVASIKVLRTLIKDFIDRAMGAGAKY
jgi:chemotaxis protein CheC